MKRQRKMKREPDTRRLRQAAAGVSMNMSNREMMMQYADPAMRDQLNLTHHSAAFVLEAEAVTVAAVTRLRDYAAEAWGITVADVRFRIDWGTRRTRAWGGTYKAGWRDEVLPEVVQVDPWRKEGAAISLPANGRLPLSWDEHGQWQEYRCFHFDREIGSFYGTARQEWLALVCHELAHAIDHSLEKTPKALRDAIAAAHIIDTSHMKDTNYGHGDRWQTIYRLFRIHEGLIGLPLTDVAPDEEDEDEDEPMTAEEEAEFEAWRQKHLPKCKQCGEILEDIERRTKRFCGPRCRVAFNRAKKKAEAQEAAQAAVQAELDEAAEQKRLWGNGS